MKIFEILYKLFIKSVYCLIITVTHCAKLNMNEKKTKQVPIQLPNIARTLFDAKKIIKKKFLAWTLEIIQFIQFENHMYGPRYLKFFFWICH